MRKTSGNKFYQQAIKLKNVLVSLTEVTRLFQFHTFHLDIAGS